jgi:hypothetical protein
VSYQRCGNSSKRGMLRQARSKSRTRDNSILMAHKCAAKSKHYDKTYSPVASWNSVRMLLTITAVHGWKTKQIDYVQAFAQAPVEKTLYMKIPAGIELEDGADPSDYVLMIHRNIYGLKQADRVWNQYLVEKLLNELGFKQSKVA